jgi:hypothetical protein
MKSATQVTVSTFGVLAGLAGIEHGVGEMLQGSTKPDGVVIESWPNSKLFRLLAGEPAMTIVPNLLVTGILSILFSLTLIVWATWFVRKKHSGLVLMLLSIAMLLVGGGFGPPLLGIIMAAVATRINAPLTWWRMRSPAGLRFLGKLWPWSYAVCLIAWLYLCPGSILLDYYFGVENPLAVVMAILAAFGSLLLTIVAGLARDSQQRGQNTKLA